MIDDTNRNWQWDDNGSILEYVQKSTAIAHHERRKAVREIISKWTGGLKNFAVKLLAENDRQMNY